MKKLLSIAVIATALLLNACSGDDDLNPENDQNDDPNARIELSGNLTTQTLTKDKKYLLIGQVFIPDGETVTIEPGTVIFGQKATRGTLIVDRGGKLIAEGTEAEPIVMTSAQAPGERDRGDWGGLVILGRARTNQVEPAIEGITPERIFGGTDDADDSGIYKYLRVEYAGIELTPNNETNSITMGGVGSGTTMEYCVVSYGGDDGFEWFGGSINGKHLVSVSTWDDDFDCDFGWSGNVQFGLVVRNPFFADQSESNAFECDNGPNDNDVQPYTTGTFSNVTVYGPSSVAQGLSGNNRHGIDLRRRTAVSITNTVVTGFNFGLRMNQPSVVEQYQNENGVLANNVLLTNSRSGNTAFLAGSGVEVADVRAIWEEGNDIMPVRAVEDNDVYAGLGMRAENFFTEFTILTYPENPNFSAPNVSAIPAANYDVIPSERRSFFEQVPYIGAFGVTDWTDGWVNFNPRETEY
ncbi:MAG: hypothetical protein LAT68_06260 [Cyclobacteriaceae bacterium]|nr:hypothetical protein [Cyclobacteriaceae bacterium]MCH8515914.1 hypothetical protein [Cyclobacteriaceae bacterium]